MSEGTGVSITGSGHTAFGRHDARALESMIVEAAQEAMHSSGVDGTGIDAVFLGHFNSGLVSDGFPSSLVHQADPALRFVPAARLENACASGAAAVFAGIQAIRSGTARRVLVVGAEKMTHRTTPEVTHALAGAGYQNDPEESDLSFPQVFGLAARDYADRYGDPLETMARIAAKNHENALRNPLAQMRREMSFEACNTISDKNPLIADPLRLTDCSLVTDGAAAVVLSADNLVDAESRAVSVRAAANVSDLLPIKARDFVAFEGPRRAISQALGQAELAIGDVHFAEVHDCFTIAELLIYEAMGLTESGRGGDAVKEGTVYRDGALPVNLSGGLKAKGHPVGATGVSMHSIAYRQLTGQAGEMQIDSPEFGLIFNMGGAAVANYASVLQAR